MAPTERNRPTAPFRPLAGRGTLDGELELGRVSGVFGVRGEVRLHLHNREASVLLDAPTEVVLVTPDKRRFTTTLTCRPGAGKRILGRLQGLSDREVAASLKGTLIVVARADLPDPDDGEFYVADLQGLAVMVDGERVGRVADVHHTDAGDVLELHVGADAHFVLFADPAVGVVDLGAGTVQLQAVALMDPEETEGR